MIFIFHQSINHGLQQWAWTGFGIRQAQATLSAWDLDGIYAIRDMVTRITADPPSPRDELRELVV